MCLYYVHIYIIVQTCASRFWKRDGGFKEDDAVWAEPQLPRAEQLPETKPLNPDHCFVAALGISGEQDVKEKEMEENMNEVL